MERWKHSYGRHSIRLKDYDYRSQGLYFITICTYKKISFFGQVTGGMLELNEYGRMTARLWQALPGYFPDVALDTYIIMPNHLHGIIAITQEISSVLPAHPPGSDAPLPPNAGSLGQIIRAFKARTTRHLRQRGLEEFAWHRNYYEHIIRGPRDLERIRRYIMTNPARAR